MGQAEYTERHGKRKTRGPRTDVGNRSFTVQLFALWSMHFYPCLYDSHPFLQLILYPQRIFSHWKHSYYISDFFINCIINGVGKTLCRHPVIAIFYNMNAAKYDQGFYISHQTVPEIISHSRSFEIVELLSLVEILGNIT